MLSSTTLADLLFNELDFTEDTSFYIALSGGVDSTVLLHLMCAIKSTHHKHLKLTALHVNHKLQSQADQWAGHCEQLCQTWGVAYKQTSLDLKGKDKKDGKGVEASARQARYQWFEQQMAESSENAVLLTAHHQQDKAETLLFNLMRGTGGQGLASLRRVRKMAKSALVRPLLACTKQELIAYANNKELNWVEDPSNQSTDYSRNYIRHKIIPILVDFRADAIDNITRCATNLEQQNEVLNEVAKQDLAAIPSKAYHFIDKSNALEIAALTELSKPRQVNAFRYWLKRMNAHTPSQQLMNQLLKAFAAPPKATAILQEDGWQFRFNQGYCYVMRALPKDSIAINYEWDDYHKSLQINELAISLTLKPKLIDLINKLPNLKLTISQRQAGDEFKDINGKNINLKRMMHDNNIPAWRRFQLPILFLDKGQGLEFVTLLSEQDNEFVQCEFK